MARKRKGDKVDGWLVVDKGLGVSSAKVVGTVKWATKAQKVGQAFMAVGSTVGAALSVVGIGLAIGVGMAAAGPVLAVGGTIALAGFGVGWAIKKFF